MLFYIFSSAFLTRAVLDCGKVSWYHIITDSVKIRNRVLPQNFLDIISSAAQDDAQRVSDVSIFHFLNL